MVATASSMIGRISAFGIRARARIESVWMVARGQSRKRARIGAGRQFARRPRVRKQSPERAIGRVDRLCDKGADLRVGDRVRGRSQDGEAAARTVLAAEIKLEGGDEDAPELCPQRRAALKQRGERLVHALAVLAIGLKVERALVAERAVEARPVEPGRRAERRRARSRRSPPARRRPSPGSRPSPARRRADGRAAAAAGSEGDRGADFCTISNKTLDAAHSMRKST